MPLNKKTFQPSNIMKNALDNITVIIETLED